MRSLYSLAFLLAAPAFAQGWEQSYSRAEGTDGTWNCQAGIYYRDATFLTRIYADDMDFYFRKDGYALPPGRYMGEVGLTFDGRYGERRFFLPARAGLADGRDGRSSYMFLQPDARDYALLLELMKGSRRASLDFPDGASWVIDLDGSRRALDAASDCWRFAATGRTDGRETVITRGTVRRDTNPFE